MAESRTRSPRDIAARARAALDRNGLKGGFRRETFSLPRAEARRKAREILDRYPVAAYGTVIESWALRPGDIIEFTIRRLPSAD
ncbi:MAG TPA: hypothetical protein VNQ56_07850 [Pseudolabrys sp.]|nr:hypothetical protein [Pseudolabrys sp.]